jgi:uncharacterized protein YceK
MMKKIALFLICLTTLSACSSIKRGCPSVAQDGSRIKQERTAQQTNIAAARVPVTKK